MPLTKSQRAAINLENSRRSTGPRTEVGRQKSRQNALKHGLRATAIALPNEDPRLADERSRAWNDHYRPRSPGAQHLVNVCVRATLLSDRIARYHDAVIAEQIRAAEAAYDRRNHIDAEPAKAGICTELDPAPALDKLATMMAGCRAMLYRWNWYLNRLQDGGRTEPGDRAEALRMMGYGPDAPLKDDPAAWTADLLVTLCFDPEPAPRLAALFDPACQPDALMPVYRADALPDRATATGLLRALVTAHRDVWSHEEECLRVDQPARVEVADRALLVQDDRSARLFLRYHAESRISFQQAYRALISTLEYDAAHAPDVPEEVDDEPDPVAPPNEANGAESVTEVIVKKEVKDEPRVAVPAPVAAATAAAVVVGHPEVGSGPARPSDDKPTIQSQPWRMV